MKIYTRTGDDGTTSLPGGRRVPKYDIRVEAYGTVDELIAWIGLLKDHDENKHRRSFLTYIQEQLMICAAGLATGASDGKQVKYIPDRRSVKKLEEEIDKMENKLRPLNNFIIPGGHIIISYCHIARCVCRRAERRVLKINESDKTPEIINKFLNRLADYLFVLSRNLSLELDIEDDIWTI